MAVKNTKKTQPKQQEEKDKKKRRRFIILFIFLIIIGLGGIGVGLFFIIKSCGPGKKEGFNIKVVQPTSQAWKLTVNGADKELNVERGTQLDIVLAPVTLDNGPEYSCLNSTNDNIFFAQVSSQKDPQTEIWRSSQLKKEGTNYVTSFKMNWSYDIVIQIASESDYEKFIYTKEDDEITYTYGPSLYDINSPIYRINTKTLEEETIERTKFSANLWVGKKVKNIDAHFLAGCSAFNGTLDFQDGICEVIDTNFMYECTKFDQPMVFPDSLNEIKGDFMMGCSSFNRPINTNNIRYMNRSAQSSFLLSCTNFNSTVIIGEKLENMPSYFLCNCRKFNKDIEIPSTVKAIGDGFLKYCDAMVSKIIVNCPESAFNFTSENICSTDNPNALCVKNGMLLAGDNAAKWKEHFPNMNDTTRNFYRTLKIY